MQKPTTTNRTNPGMRIEKIDVASEPTSSIVDTSGLATPALTAVDLSRVKTVAPWTTPAAPPPRISAVPHLTSGGTSPTTDALAMMPATTADGVETTSSK